MGIDRFAPPHCFGSSHGESRIIRQAYHESPFYVPLVRAAYPLWEELEQVAGKKLLVKTGGLGDVVGALPGALAGHGVTVTTLLPGYSAILEHVGDAPFVHHY